MLFRSRTSLAMLSLVAAICTIAGSWPASAQTPAGRPFTTDDIAKMKTVGEPQLSPDGAWIAYALTVTNFDKNSRSVNIWLVGAAGGEPRRITASEKSDNTPEWSPDGRSLAFLSTRYGNAQIYVLPMRGGEARTVTDFPGGVDDMIWTPDGKGFVFAARTYLDCPDLDCIKKRDEAKENDKVKAMVHEHLMYRHWNAYEDGKVQHFFYVPVDGGTPRDLAPALKFDALTYWLASAGRDFELTPDGTVLYFSGKQEADQAVSYNEEIWRVPLAGREVERVTKNPAADAHPRISPDGKWLAYRATRRPGYESDRYELTVMALPGRAAGAAGDAGAGAQAAGEPRSLTADFDRSVGDFF